MPPELLSRTTASVVEKSKTLGNGIYAIDYRPFELRRARVFTRSADERVGAELAVMLLLSSGARITEIRCDGVKISDAEFDRLLKAAAGRVAGGLLRASLALDAEQVRARFGFAT